MLGVLKFITCGSVDDGKSTLIGRMLYDSKLVYADQAQALELAQKTTTDGELDYALLLDGLMAEREQGITIDVAYRYFTTKQRSFIVADCPGHEQYTRNMAVGASFADVAVILVDASKGISMQTNRHIMVCAMMGIKYMLLAVNKMDLVEYDKNRWEEIYHQFKAICLMHDIIHVESIPLSAKKGDNIAEKSINMLWYKGPTLFEYLNNIEIDTLEDNDDFFAMPVQRVSRPNADFRGFQGEIVAGQISIGDEITVLPNKNIVMVKEIFLADKKVVSAKKGQPITLTLDREIDVSRGSVVFKNYKLQYSNLFNAKILWMDDKKVLTGGKYLLKCGTTTIPASIMDLKCKIDINTGAEIIVNAAHKNDIINCDVITADKIVFDSFKNRKELGGFILIDRITNMTAGCGIINYSLRRAENLTWQKTDITREIRAKQKNQTPLTIWFTGLSGSGKSTLANALEKYLVAANKHTMILDGDNVRMGLNKNLSFKEKDRAENIRRISEVSKLMNDAGIIVLTSFISPFESDRNNAKEIIGTSFFEVYVSTPLEVCEQRDVKGLYKKSREGEIPFFTGISSPYETPKNPDMVVDTSEESVDEIIDRIWDKIKNLI